MSFDDHTGNGPEGYGFLEILSREVMLVVTNWYVFLKTTRYTYLNVPAYSSKFTEIQNKLSFIQPHGCDISINSFGKID